MSSDKNKEIKNPFQDTLNLPKTDFSMRANSITKEPELLARWEKENLWNKSWSKNKGKKKFVLHDGPPYANGHIHIGHVLNKVLKDIVTKYKRMSGFHAPVKPGWDCHGLPVEIKVVEQFGDKLKTVDKIEFKKLCREYAQSWINVQREEFKQLAVLMDWQNPYLTMSLEYESAVLRAFSKFVKDGFVERKNKTVPWCVSCQTVLATAEIEYKDRKDPSLYVLFPLDAETSKKLFPENLKNNPKLQVNLLIWTTTPWTLPLNRAVVLNSNAKYVLLAGSGDLAFVVAKDLADKLCTLFGIEKKVLNEFDSKLFESQKVNHCFIPDLKVPVLLDNSVLLEEGTACMHSAPGCGPEDYVLGIKNGLEIFSPLSPDGKYTQGIQPKELEGMSIADGQIWVIKKLAENGKLLFKNSITHAYPHCWRCRNGLMFRATKQWFCQLQKGDLIEKSLAEIEKISFVPETGRARLQSFVGGRTEWCISRQRTWGVPIPALICQKCDNAFLDADFVEKISQHVAKEGIEFWDRVSIEELITLGLLKKDFKCKCGAQLADFKKEYDILDVWLEAGVSHYAVLAQDPNNLGIPADLYLEGSDQHRGWFQSALLSSMILNDTTCTKEFLTHGYVVDEKGYKMSKSLGNVVSPEDVVKKFSRDILRLWVASSDYKDDIAISEKILGFVSQSYSKIRNTSRFMISNLYDFDITKDAVPFEKLLKVDQYALARLHQINDEVTKAYQAYDFAAVFHALNNYFTVDLSSLYLDICKDRLYVEQADGHLRRSAQTAIYQILDTVTKLMAPILSFLSEEISDFYQKNKSESIHMQEFAQTTDIWALLTKKSFATSPLHIGVTETSATYTLAMQNLWNTLLEMREVVLKAIEQKRADGIVKHPLEGKVTLYIDKNSDQKKIIDTLIKDFAQDKDANRFFKDWFIVSQVKFLESFDGLDQTRLPWIFVKVEHADGDKCPRCWQWEKTDHSEKLCARCASVLNK
jgi:isoleucyl-tRNA synthetase